MKRKIKRWLTFALAFMLTVTSVDLSALYVEAETVASEKTYSFSQLTEMTNGYKKSISSSGVLNISGMPQYSKEEYFLFPEGIEPSTITKITVNLADGQSASSLALKTYNSSWGVLQEDYSGSGVMNVDSSKLTDAYGFSFMNKESAAMDIVINSVTITAKASVSDNDAKDTTYTFNDLTERWGANTKKVGASGKLTALFSTQYQEVKFAYPEGIADKVTKITLNVESGAVSNFVLKAYNSDWSNSLASYQSNDGTSGNVLIDRDVVGTNPAGFGIMSNGGVSDFNTVITGVTFTVEEEVVEADYTITVEAPTLKKDWASAETVALENGSYRVFFGTGSYAESRFDLPVTESIDLTKCETITFKLAEANTQPVNFYVSTTDSSYSTTKYNLNNQSGSTEYVLNVQEAFADKVTAGTLGSIEEVGVQIAGGADTATAEVKLSEIVFKMKGSGEDVLYNGYTVTYKAAGLTIDEDNNRAASCEFKDGKYSMTFDAANQETRFVFQDGTSIDLSKCAKIIFNTSNQVGSTNFYVSTSSGKVDSYYGKTGNVVEVTPAVTTGMVDSIYVQVAGDPITEGSAIDFESVTFVMSGEGTDAVYDSAVTEDETPTGNYTITVYANALTHDWSQTEITNAVGTDNRLAIAFGIENNDSRYDLPTTIDLANVEKVTFNVCDQVGRHNISLSLDGTKVGDPISNQKGTTFEMVPTVTTGTINEVVFQAAGWDYTDDNTLTVESVVFTMKKTADETDKVYGDAPIDEEEPPVESTENITPTAEGTEDKRYTYKNGSLTYNYSSSTLTYEAQDVEKVAITFGGAWNEIQFKLPETIDLANCETVTFATSEQSVPLSYKFYDIDGNEIEDITQYSKTGETYTYTVSDRTEKINMIAVMLHSDDVADTNTCVFDGVLFNMKAEEPEEEPAENYTITVYANALAHDWSQTGISNTLGEDNRLTIAFGIENNDSRYDLPTTIDLANVEKVTFNVCDQVGRHNISLSLDGTKVGDPISNQKGTTFEMVPTVTTGTINEVVFQAAGWDYTDDNTLTVESVVFTMKKTADETDKVYGDAPIDEEEPPVDTTQNITIALEGEEDYTWLANEVTKGYDTTVSPELDETVARWNLTFGGNWQEVRFELPEEVDMSTCNTMTIAVPEQSAALSFKLYDSEENEVWADYHKSGETQYEYNFSSADAFTAKYFAIMLHADDKVNARETASFDGITFDMKAEDEIIETYEISYGYSDLVYDWDNAATCELVEGGWKITMSDLNQGARFKLPEQVNMEKCIGITFTVASQTGPVNFFTYLDSSEIEHFYYKTGATEYTVKPTATNKINAIAIMSGGETFTEGAGVTITGVSFLMEGKEPLPTPEDGVYNMNHFETDDVSDGVTVTTDEDAGIADITFAADGDSITLEVPDSVDLNHLTAITANGSGLAAVKMEVLDAEGNVIATADGNRVETGCNPEVKYVRFTATEANTTITLENLAFTVDPKAFEAIVLNGNFAREDVSMWSAALWGSVNDVATTITAVESETPVVGNIYSYGEVSRRSSPYVCFAQNITDRVKLNTNYTFSFYAKLSDDYANAPASQRTVEFAPYYVNSYGKEIYTPKIIGKTKAVLEPGKWEHFYGYFLVPCDATNYTIRIVEQGTNYGKGDCVMGSYAVTGVVVEEFGDANSVTYPSGWSGSGSGGSGANTTITKEATWIGTYDMDDLLVEWASATYGKNSNDGLDIVFTNNYDEVRMDLPRELDMSTAAYVKAKISSQNVPIAVKLYYKGSQVDVGYYNNIQSEYTLVPTYTGMVDAIGIMSLATPNPAGAFAVFDSITFGLTQEPAPLPVRTDIVLNGDFSDPDLSDWKASFWGDGVTMTQHTSSTAIAPGVYNYASYSKRTSPYQCFAQDITDMVEEGETYTFSFWAKLSDDYIGAPESQRIIQFAPYTVDSDGVADYNPKLEGTYLQVCEPGVWTYFEGTYKVTNPNDVKKVVIRILEQGTNYGKGECVLGGFSIADVKMAKYIPEPPSIDEDVPNLKDALTDVFGEDFIVGTAATIDELDDIGIEMLVNKHFNAITLGNELKPDALFNYSNSQHTDLQTITFNGEKLVVPTLSFYRADDMLDTILEWNESHPESPIKVRGHVLVWHAQTPEWFFRENYVVGQNADGTENYVTPEVMNLRLEWYIKTVLEHYVGEDSPYKDLFYGWDVVNEAVSNGGNGYRTDKVSSVESPSADTHSNNSSWWAVYQSNEFIINAFKYANKYAPAELELYYNDYNECDNKKMVGIVQLLTDVKNAEGTRIDGMGMQAHYNMFNPGMKAFEEAIRAYAAVVDKVMITEFDMKVSGDISTEEKKQAEYLAQGARYRDFYEIMKALKEEGINVSGITFWGTIDKYSWLQDSSSVGGGADGELTQCPLLFDDNYKVKPSYWAFVDYSVIDPDYVAPTLSTAEVEKEPVEEPVEDKPVEEPAVEATPEPEKDSAVNATTESEEKNSSVLPIAIGGGVAGVGIIGVIIAWLKKRKKSITE